MPSIGDPSADRYLAALVERLRTALGSRLIGAWLVNSGARDDYLPGRSDLDVAVAVTEALDATVKRHLADALRHRSLACPAPRLELVVYRRAVLAHPGPRPDWELNLNTGPAIDDRVGIDPSSEPPHWFVLDLAGARERAQVLVGPPLERLLGPLPHTVVMDALLASAAWHAAHDGAAPNRVLNACRAWRWLEERRWSSKTEAAEWAVTAGGDAGLIALALARRRGETDDPIPAERIAGFTATVEERLRQAAGRRS